jgi:hypothetical protein
MHLSVRAILLTGLEQDAPSPQEIRPFPEGADQQAYTFAQPAESFTVELTTAGSAAQTLAALKVGHTHARADACKRRQLAAGSATA